MDFLKFILHLDTLNDRGILKFHNIFTKIVYIYIYIYIYICLLARKIVANFVLL